MGSRTPDKRLSPQITQLANWTPWTKRGDHTDQPPPRGQPEQINALAVPRRPVRYVPSSI